MKVKTCGECGRESKPDPRRLGYYCEGCETFYHYTCIQVWTGRWLRVDANHMIRVCADCLQGEL